MLRIVVADYSGHPFQVQLSRELARRGHAVLHLHFAEFQTPKGRLTRSAEDPATLAIEAISIGRVFAKHSFVRRRFQEIEVGRLFSKRILAFKPDVVLGSNLPLDALLKVQRDCSRAGIAFVYWQQDIYSIAITRVLEKKFGVLGQLVGRFYRKIEQRILHASSAVVVISDDFVSWLEREYGLSADKIHVIHNWAPIDEIRPQPKDGPWARANGLVDKTVVLYSGTLGLKHDPNQILELAEAMRCDARTMVVVVSEGPASEWLKQQAVERNLGALRVLPFQPFEIYEQVLGSADILLSLLEADASSFSVPSKVLSYLCAQRPILLSASEGNLAARIVRSAGAGLVCAAGDCDSLIKNARTLSSDAALRERAGENGYAYAIDHFNIKKICDDFSIVIAAATNAMRGSGNVDEVRETLAPASLAAGSSIPMQGQSEY